MEQTKVPEVRQSLDLACEGWPLLHVHSVHILCTQQDLSDTADFLSHPLNKN